MTERIYVVTDIEVDGVAPARGYANLLVEVLRHSRVVGRRCSPPGSGC